MGTLLPRLAARLRREAGLGLVEVVVAAGVFLVMAGAGLTMLSKAEAVTAGAEQHEAAVALAQREMEKLRQRGWAKLGLTSLPAAAAASTGKNPLDPGEYVSGNLFKVRSNFRDRTSAAPEGSPAAGETVVVLATGAAPGPTRVSAGGYLFDVYPYVTWADQTCVLVTTSADACSETQDAKRIVVAVKPVPGAQRTELKHPVWVTGLVTDPSALSSAANAPTPAPGTTTQTAQPFFLYDTACDQTSRQAIAGSHATHDTARSGNHCASASNRPDLMGTSAPPSGGTEPPMYDYSSDFPVARPDGKGLALSPPLAGLDCPTSYLSALAAVEQHYVHRWASVAMPYTFTSSTRSAVSLWTKTVNGLAGQATVCASLHRMSAAGALSASPLATTTHTIASPTWPQEATQVAFAFDHAAFTVPAGERLVLTVSLARSSLATGIELLYDHPSYDSVLSVGTTTPLP